MYRITTILALFGLIGTTVLAGPKIKFETMEHNFGEIDKSGPVSYNFKFTNDGDETLEIKAVKPSCGCTSATPDKREYKPGESGTIPVEFNPSRFSGKITKSIKVTTNDAETPEMNLMIYGQIVEDVLSRPISLFFPKVKRSGEEVKVIDVSTDRMDKLVISDVSAEPEYLSARVEQVNDKTAKIFVTALGDKFPAGKNRVTGIVSYSTNSEGAQKNMRTTVTINVEEPIAVHPRTTLYFYGAKQGVAKEAQVTLKSTEGKKLEISDLKTDLEFLKLQVENVDDFSKSLKVTLTEGAEKGRFQGKITIKTNIEGQNEIVIPVRGAVN